MDTKTARKLFEQYASAMAYVCVRTPDGTESIGSAFHVGEGVFVTARHVVDRTDILSVATTESYFVPAPPAQESTEANARYMTPHSFAGTKKLAAGPFFHPDDKVDMAVFVIEKTDEPYPPAVPLGSHLDDFMDTALILTSAIVMGYPPIPMSSEPVLIAARAEINAIIGTYHAPHPRFILSTMSRGGFSGGLALSEFGFALGVIIESLVRNAEPTQLGFFSVLSIEPIYVCLSAHKVLPELQREAWGNLNIWDDVQRLFSDADSTGSASDGIRYTRGGCISGRELESGLVVNVQCSKPDVERTAAEAVKRITAAWEGVHVTEKDTGAIEVTWPAWPKRNPTILEARAARLKVESHLHELISAAAEVLVANGYREY
jgi:hypothetical protein